MAESNGAANVRNFLLIQFYVSNSTIDFDVAAAYIQTTKPYVMGGIEVLLLLGGGAALYFWNLSRAASNLIYSPGNITAFQLDGLSPIIYADFIVQNTNNVSFTINSLAATVQSNDTVIGTITNFTPVQIPGNNQARIPISLTLQPIGLVSDIISIITGGVGNRDLRIRGTVNANGIQAPFDLVYKIGS